jgi:hypothetical protein
VDVDVDVEEEVEVEVEVDVEVEVRLVHRAALAACASASTGPAGRCKMRQNPICCDNTLDFEGQGWVECLRITADICLRFGRQY